jgi:hypothetical protein
MCETRAERHVVHPEMMCLRKCMQSTYFPDGLAFHAMFPPPRRLLHMHTHAYVHHIRVVLIGVGFFVMALGMTIVRRRMSRGGGKPAGSFVIGSRIT